MTALPRCIENLGRLGKTIGENLVGLVRRLENLGTLDSLAMIMHDHESLGKILPRSWQAYRCILASYQDRFHWTGAMFQTNFPEYPKRRKCHNNSDSSVKPCRVEKLLRRAKSLPTSCQVINAKSYQANCGNQTYEQNKQ